MDFSYLYSVLAAFLILALLLHFVFMDKYGWLNKEVAQHVKC